MGRQKLPSGEQRAVKTTFRMTEADAEGLVALIRNTINNDWNEFKANALA